MLADSRVVYLAGLTPTRRILTGGKDRHFEPKRPGRVAQKCYLVLLYCVGQTFWFCDAGYKRHNSFPVINEVQNLTASFPPRGGVWFCWRDKRCRRNARRRWKSCAAPTGSRFTFLPGAKAGAR